MLFADMRHTVRESVARNRWLFRLILVHAAVAAVCHAQELVDEVDPFIGTSFGAHTFPGALLPWGMVSVSPHTDFNDPSGYYWHDPNRLRGFGHVHLSGVGCFDLANVALMPTTGRIETSHEAFSSIIRHETASPGYYGCFIERYGIDAAMTATERAGFSRYVFGEATNEANILLDISQGVTKSLGGHVRIVSDTEIEGWNRSGRFCGSPTQQDVHFVVRVSRPAASATVWSGGILRDGSIAHGTSIGAAMTFTARAGDTIFVKVGISYTSIENARRNLDEEIPGWSFDRVHADARARWEEELGRIRVSGGTPEQRTVFYTALYHTMFHPNLFHDAGGDYRRFGNRGVGRVDGYDRYTVYSLWDTYRTLHPLMAMVWPQRQNDMTRTIVEKYRESGWLPKWSLMGMDAFAMSGDPAAIVIADSWAKGARDFDLTTAFEGMRRSATDTRVDNWIRPGLAAYHEHGHIPPDHRTGHWYVYGPTSTALEYHLADAMIATIASELCLADEYQKFTNRSCGYHSIWDKETRFFRPRDRDGNWSQPWHPSETYADDLYYTEGNAYHYRFSLPHDTDALIGLHGGDSAFVGTLQSFFDTGRFVWNEHDIAYPYLFTMVDGESWRTHEMVRELMKDFTAEPWGIRTNEDSGTISAWYVLSAIGLFPVEYGTDRYQLGSPIFDTVTITPARSGARPFVVTAAGTSDARRFVVGATLDDRPLERTHIKIGEIVAGGRLELAMSSTRASWGTRLRAPDSMLANSTSSGSATVVQFSWRPSRSSGLVRLQVAEDPTFCSTIVDTLLLNKDISLNSALDASNRAIWWRTATIDEHGAHAWSRPTLHEIRPLPSVVVDDHSLWLERIGPQSARAHFRLPLDRMGSLIVYDIVGREVFRTGVVGCKDIRSIPLDLTGLSRGMYVCRLVSDRASVALPMVLR